MARRVVVTRAQKIAAQAMVERLEATGRPVPDAVRKIANAEREVRPAAKA
jgi:hypothetical protein